MAYVKWIKIVTDIFDDEKILLIESMPEHDSIIVIWFKLLCLAGKQNNHGVFMLSERMPYTDEMFSAIFRRPVNTVRMALDVFEQFGMIERINDAVAIPNWDKHQSLDALEKKREADRERQRRFRLNQKAISNEAENNNEDVTRCSSVTSHSRERVRIRIREDIDKDNRESIEESMRGEKPSPSVDFDDALSEAFDSYLSMRKRTNKGKDISPESKNAIHSQLLELDTDGGKKTFDSSLAVRILNQSTANEWKTLFLPKKAVQKEARNKFKNFEERDDDFDPAICNPVLREQKEENDAD